MNSLGLTWWRSDFGIEENCTCGYTSTLLPLEAGESFESLSVKRPIFQTVAKTYKLLTAYSG